MRCVHYLYMKFECVTISREMASVFPSVILNHYSGVIMSAMASQITGFSIAYSTVCSGSDQRKHQSSASLAFVRGIHLSPVNSPHPLKPEAIENVIRKMSAILLRPKYVQSRRLCSLDAELVPYILRRSVWQTLLCSITISCNQATSAIVAQIYSTEFRLKKNNGLSRG